MLFERNSPARCFVTPPPQSPWKSSRPSRSPTNSTMLPLSERKKSPSPASANKGDLFHIIHKVPAGDSPYVKAKQVQLVDKDPGRAISLFWAAINAGDRVESALKDMALVMKQLNRSDEAIEAIKSFRHLCPSDSQESLDNILVELYKRSGRVDEEIAMLHHKLKQIEEGVTFVGRTTKQARSQGKKIQITAEQEISRILGNLAWAYLQKGDYKTSEEHYRKALSFEVDRNKQCNLAICLMQMNKISEAKFLLQAVSTATKNRKMDDSFVKSFERASQMLQEIESSSSLVDPVKVKDDKSKQTQGSSVRSTMSQCSTQNSENLSGKNSDIVVKSRTESWSSTSEVEAPHARRRLYDSPDHPARRDHQKEVPYTKPKRCSWGFNNGHQRETWGGDVHSHSDPKPSFGSPHNEKKYGIMHPNSTQNHLSSPTNAMWRSRSTLEDPAIIAKHENATVIGSGSLHTLNTEATMKFTEKDKSAEESYDMALINLDEFASGNRELLHKKSWADIVEEEQDEEQQFFSSGYTNLDGLNGGAQVFNDENENSNIVHHRPWPPHSQTECLNQKLESSLNLKDGYNHIHNTQPGNAILLRNPTARRSLCFNPELTKERGSLSGEKKPTRRNRLQVFQDITPQPETP